MSGWPGGFPPEIDHLHPPADQIPERLELPVDENGRLFVSAEWVGWIDNVLRRSREINDKNDRLGSENFELKKRLAVRVDLEVQAAAVAYIASLATTERLLVALQEAVAKMAEIEKDIASTKTD